MLWLEMLPKRSQALTRSVGVAQVRNRVVYDSLDAPPDRFKAAQAASGDPAAAAAMVGPPAPSDGLSSKYIDGTLLCV